MSRLQVEGCPPYLTRHSMVAFEEGHMILVYGGFLMATNSRRVHIESALPNLSGELWKLDMNAKRWSLVDTYFNGQEGKLLMYLQA